MSGSDKTLLAQSSGSCQTVGHIIHVGGGHARRRVARVLQLDADLRLFRVVGIDGSSRKLGAVGAWFALAADVVFLGARDGDLGTASAIVSRPAEVDRIVRIVTGDRSIWADDKRALVFDITVSGIDVERSDLG